MVSTSVSSNVFKCQFGNWSTRGDTGGIGFPNCFNWGKSGFKDNEIPGGGGSPPRPSWSLGIEPELTALTELTTPGPDGPDGPAGQAGQAGQAPVVDGFETLLMRPHAPQPCAWHGTWHGAYAAHAAHGAHGGGVCDRTLTTGLAAGATCCGGTGVTCPGELGLTSHALGTASVGMCCKYPCTSSRLCDSTWKYKALGNSSFLKLG